ADVDLSKDLLAWVTGVAYDAAAHTATVSTTPGERGGLLEVDLAYGTSAWHVFGPPSGSALSVTLPALPASLGSLAPAAGQAVSGSAALVDTGETYDTLKTLAPFAVWHYTGHDSGSALYKVRVSR